MNKKFTMMLAAFLAAGYTITAEAGVVKVSQPTTGKAYYIGDGTGIYLQKTENNNLLKGVAFSEATEWNVTFESDAEVTIEKEGTYIEFMTGFKSSTTQYKRISFTRNEDGIFMRGYDVAEGFLKIKEGDVESKNSTESATPLSFYIETTEISEDNEDVAFVIGDKYAVIDEEDGLVFKSLYEYVSLKNKKTVWTIKDGKVSNGTSYIGLDDKGNLTLVEAAKAVTFEKGEDKLVVTEDKESLSSYLVATETGFATSESPSDEAVEYATVAAVINTIVPEDLDNDNPVNDALVGFPSNSRLYVYEAGKYVAMGDNSAITFENSVTKDNGYWSLDGTKVKGAKGYLVVGGQQDFKVYVQAGVSGLKKFYLQSTVTGQFVGLNAAGTGFELETSAENAVVFSAVAPVQDAMTAVEVNDVNRGASFNLVYKFSDDKPATENPFNKNMKAFYVTGDKSTFYLATKWPAKYNGKVDCEISASELTSDDFTFFVATTNEEDWNIQKFDEIGEGVKFKEVAGSRLVASDYEDIKAGKHILENAQFQMNQDVISEEYVLSMPCLAKFDDDEVLQHSAEMKIALVDDQKGRIVTTILARNEEESGKIKFGATISNTRTVKPSDFLSTEKASVFNIKFVSKVIAGSLTGNDANTFSEYNKYLTTLGVNNLLAHGVNFANLNAPENQWIVTEVSDNVYTFQNRENDKAKFKAELLSTDKSNVYELISLDELDQYAYVNKDGEYKITTVDQPLSGLMVELTAITPNAEAGYATSELDKAGLVRFVFNRINENNTAVSDFYVVDDNNNLVVDKEESKAAQFSVVKFDAASTSTALSDSIYADNDYVILKEAGKNDSKTVEDGDSIKVVSYAFKQLRNDKKVYYLDENFDLVPVTDESEAPRFIVKLYKNGSYGLIPVTSDYLRVNINNNSYTFGLNPSTLSIGKNESVYYNYLTRTFDFNILKETPGTSYNHVPQHVTMEAVNGGYIAMNAENKEGIVAPVSTLKAEYTKEDLTFWLDTTDSEAVTPSFMISKAGNYMYNATDSLDYYNDGTASADKAKEFGIQVGGNTDLLPKAIFQAADLAKVEDIENYKFQIIQSADADDEYVIRSLNDYSYVAAHNQKLYFTSEAKEALKLIVTPAEAPTSNEGVAASEVKVVAQDGAVVVKNAAGKNVVVSTILGQVVANEVLTSDNATINVPAGIVVVAVEGESFKVNVK